MYTCLETMMEMNGYKHGNTTTNINNNAVDIN